MKQSRKISFLLHIVAFLGLALIATAVSVSIGEFSIPFFKIPNILLADGGSIEYLVLTEIRLPRAILGLAVGGSLSIAGVILQGVYRNPLVEPYTLGISGGAALGVTVAMVFGLVLTIGSIVLPIAGFAGALVAVLVVYILSSFRTRIDTNQMVLLGVMVSFISSSIMMLLLSLTSGQNLQGVFFWVMGSLDVSNKSLVVIATLVAFTGLVISYFFVHPLNALRLGQESARHLGVNTEAIIKILFVLASLMAGVSVAVAGVIGFVGLVVPHFTRGIVGSDFRVLLACSFFAGGGFLVLSDSIARTVIAPSELPIGVITGIIGGITFIVIMGRKSFKNKYM